MGAAGMYGLPHSSPPAQGSQLVQVGLRLGFHGRSYVQGACGPRMLQLEQPLVFWVSRHLPAQPAPGPSGPSPTTYDGCSLEPNTESTAKPRSISL